MGSANPHPARDHVHSTDHWQQVYIVFQAYHANQADQTYQAYYTYQANFDVCADLDGSSSILSR